LNDGFWVLEEDIVEIEVKGGVEKSLTGRWCSGRDELGDSRPALPERGQWNTLQVFGGMRVGNDVAEERMALTQH
jgi:hypothetical protein